MWPNERQWHQVEDDSGEIRKSIYYIPIMICPKVALAALGDFCFPTGALISAVPNGMETSN